VVPSHKFFVWIFSVTISQVFLLFTVEPSLYFVFVFVFSGAFSEGLYFVLFSVVPSHKLGFCFQWCLLKKCFLFSVVPSLEVFV
jgi:hypothetical protein